MSRSEKRSAARLAAVQALYEMDIAGTGVMEAVAEFENYWIGREIEGMTFRAPDVDLFRDIIAGVVREQKLRLNEALAKGWPLKRVEAVLRAVLRAGAYELFFRKDIPVRVTISEYVDVARAFYDEDEPGLVNAVLDTLARSVRADELTARP